MNKGVLVHRKQPRELLNCKEEEKTNFIPCKFLHYGGSCYECHGKIFCVVFFKALRFYGPVHLIPLFLAPSNLRNRKLETIIRRLLLDIIRSTSFFSAYGMLFCFASCIGRNTLQKDHWATTFFAGGFGGLSLFAEDPLRREEVAIWCFPRIMEIIYRGLKKRGFINTPEHSDILLFAVAMGFILYFMKKSPQIFSTVHRGAFRIIFGKN